MLWMCFCWFRCVLGVAGCSALGPGSLAAAPSMPLSPLASCSCVRTSLLHAPGAKDFVTWSDLAARVPQLLQQIQADMLAAARARYNASLEQVSGLTGPAQQLWALASSCTFLCWLGLAVHLLDASVYRRLAVFPLQGGLHSHRCDMDV